MIRDVRYHIVLNLFSIVFCYIYPICRMDYTITFYIGFESVYFLTSKSFCLHLRHYSISYNKIYHYSNYINLNYSFYIGYWTPIIIVTYIRSFYYSIVKNNKCYYDLLFNCLYCFFFLKSGYHLEMSLKER